MTRTSCRPFIVLYLLGFPWTALAVDLKVTDEKAETLVRNVVIDYTPRGVFPVRVDKESLGLRVSEGAGRTLVKWTDITEVNLRGLEKVEEGLLLKGDITLKSGKTASPQSIHLGELTGRTDLGRFIIQLDQVKSIVPVAQE